VRLYSCCGAIPLAGLLEVHSWVKAVPVRGAQGLMSIAPTYECVFGEHAPFHDNGRQHSKVQHLRIIPVMLVREIGVPTLASCTELSVAGSDEDLWGFGTYSGKSR
jgi:hypothetical protein